LRLEGWKTENKRHSSAIEAIPPKPNTHIFIAATADIIDLVKLSRLLGVSKAGRHPPHGKNARDLTLLQ
jgi:hypothetical protein